MLSSKDLTYLFCCLNLSAFKLLVRSVAIMCPSYLCSFYTHIFFNFFFINILNNLINLAGQY